MFNNIQIKVKLLICIHLARILRMKSPYTKSDIINKSTKKHRIPKDENTLNDLNDVLSKGYLSCHNLEAHGRDDSGVFLKNSSHSSNSKSNKALHIGLNSVNHYSHLKVKPKDYNGYTGPFPTGLHYLLRENSTYSHSSFDNTNNEVFTNIRTDVCSLRKSLGLILRELCCITARIKDNEECEKKELWWKFAAQVIDRLCMVIFAILTLLSTVFILFTSKNFFKDSDPGMLI